MNKIFLKRVLAFVLPKLAQEWHPTKNGEITPQDVTYGSSKSAWWICNKCNYEWNAVISSRSMGRGCPRCKGKIVTNKNRLLIKRPLLSKEWHPIKNGNLSPKDVSYLSGKKAWWKCSMGHEWESVISSRSRGIGCPYCSGRATHINNCLSFKDPKLSREWHKDKNENLTPNDFVPNSHKKVWWKCKRNHEWQATIAHRHGGEKCPYCVGRKASTYNSLLTKKPNLSKEWNYDRNGELTPRDFTVGSGKKVWWKCKICNNQWIAAIYSRSNGRGCPNCSAIVLKDGEKCDSLTEAYFYLIFKKDGLNFLHNKKYGLLGNSRYDFYFPKENKYIEVSGFSPRSERYLKYIKNIRKKEKFVHDKLHSDFQFIYHKLTEKQSNYVKRNIYYAKDQKTK